MLGSVLGSKKNQRGVQGGSKALSSKAHSIRTGGPLHIVDQREYQENCEKIIEANAGLQDAINLT